MRVLRLLVWVSVVALLCSPASAYVISFDDLPSGTSVHGQYNSEYGIFFEDYFVVTDHSSSSWGIPHSGSNVATSVPHPYMNLSRFIFKKDTGTFHVDSVGAYFSTKPGVVLDMFGCDGAHDNVVAVARIGEAGRAWENQFVQVSGTISLVLFRPVTTDALLNFSMDDLTITPVPEPSSLAMLVWGLGGGVGFAIRRRR